MGRRFIIDSVSVDSLYVGFGTEQKELHVSQDWTDCIGALCRILLTLYGYFESKSECVMEFIGLYSSGYLFQNQLSPLSIQTQIS